MNIGIITFHWGTNYGAVLQAYALQQYLCLSGHEAFIINYKPKRYNISNPIGIIKGLLSPIEFWRKFKKENSIKHFRIANLKLTARYNSLKELQSHPPKANTYICGSDQIWNTSFLKYGERNGSTAYFLDFGDIGIKRIGYAVSLGTTDYPKEALKKISVLIKRFSAISVRENSGIDILKPISNVNIEVVPDPTLLLRANDYEKLIVNHQPKSNRKNYVFTYFLHGRERYTIDKIRAKYTVENIVQSTTETIEEWLVNIKNAKVVYTNSYHGLIFSLIFHVPVWVVLEKLGNTGMNDRFYTLLNHCNLLNRIISEESLAGGRTLNENGEIDWAKVDIALSTYSSIGKRFIAQHL